MWKFIQGHFKEVWKGFIGGCFAGGTFLYAKQDLLAKGVISLTIVFISGCLGAMGTALGNDIYKGKFNKRVKDFYNKWKHRLFKNKKDKNGQQKSDEERA